MSDNEPPYARHYKPQEMMFSLLDKINKKLDIVIDRLDTLENDIPKDHIRLGPQNQTQTFKGVFVNNHGPIEYEFEGTPAQHAKYRETMEKLLDIKNGEDR